MMRFTYGGEVHTEEHDGTYTRKQYTHGGNIYSETYIGWSVHMVKRIHGGVYTQWSVHRVEYTR